MHETTPSTDPPSPAHLQPALLSLTTSSSTPHVIHQAQRTLLHWEHQHTDEYVVSLLSFLTHHDSALRLSALLALKAAIGRRWKDRGRGKLSHGKFVCEAVKRVTRRALLRSMTGADDVDRWASESCERRRSILEDRALQSNVAALLALLARMDLPVHFRELVPTLVEGVRVSGERIVAASCGDATRMHRTVQFNCVMALEAVLEEMRSRRLWMDKEYRDEIAVEYLGTLVRLGLAPSLERVDIRNYHSGSFGENRDEDREDGFSVQYATMTSRAVSHLIAPCLAKLVEDPSVVSTVDYALEVIHDFLSHWLPVLLRPDAMSHEGMRELVSVQCAFIMELQKNHVAAFGRYLDPFLKLFYDSFRCIVEELDSVASACHWQIPPPSEGFATIFLSFLANVTSSCPCESNEAPCEENGDPSIHLTPPTNVWNKFFTPSVLQSLIPNLLLLFSSHVYSPNNHTMGHESGDDKFYWDENPEGFYQWEMTRSSEDDVGCSAQNLFLALMECPRGKEVLLPWFVGLLTNVKSQQLAMSVEAGVEVPSNVETLMASMPLGYRRGRGEWERELILQWDAIYTGAGLAGGMLEGCPGFDFCSWFDSVLGPGLELLLGCQLNRKCLPVIQRRIIWLLSCNAHQLDLSSRHNPLGMLVSVLSKHDNQNDVCVRLTVIIAMEALLPQCEEMPDLLQSIVEPTIPAIYRLTSDCVEVEHRTACLDLISSLITYVMVSGGTLHVDILNSIATPLASIWDNAVDQNLLLKRNVLSILSCIASYVGPNQAAVLYPMALPMIDNSLQCEENVFLVEDALRLWFVFLRLSKAYDALIGTLFVQVAKLSQDLEHVIILMKITEHYIILGGENFLNDHATTLQTALSNLVGGVSPRGEAFIALVTEALLRQFPAEGGMLLLQCGVLKKFLDACSLNWSESNESEPDRVILLYLTALARVFIASPGILKTLGLFSAGSAFGVNELIHLYTSKFQMAGNGPHGLLFQKLWAMLLLSFYPPAQAVTCTSVVLTLSNPIFKMCTYVLQNVNPDGMNLLSYEVGYDDDEETYEVDAGAEINEAMRQNVQKKDIVVSTNFLEYISLKLAGLPDYLGQESYQNFINRTTDPEVLRQLNELIHK